LQRRSFYESWSPITRYSLPITHYFHLIIANLPFFVCPALFVIMYIYIPLAIGCPLLFFTSQLNSPAGVSFSSSYTNSPDTLNIFIFECVVRLAKYIFVWPMLGLNGFGYACAVFKSLCNTANIQ